MKGSPQRRLRESSSSRRQAGQGARSATRLRATRPMPSGTAVPAGSALIMSRGVPAAGGPGGLPPAKTSTSLADQCGLRGSSRAAGGRASPSEARKHSRSARRPTRSSRTPSGPLWRLPPRPSRQARRCTAGRKPTPCTTPRQSRRRRALVASADRSPAAPTSTATGWLAAPSTPVASAAPDPSTPVTAAGPAARRGRRHCGLTPPEPRLRAPRRPDGPAPARAQSPPPSPGRSC